MPHGRISWAEHRERPWPAHGAEPAATRRCRRPLPVADTPHAYPVCSLVAQS